MALFQKTTKKEIKRETDESRIDEVSQEELQAGTAYLNETASDVYQREEEDEFNLSSAVRMQLKLDETVRDKLLEEYPSIFTKAMLGTDTTAKGKLEKILTTVKFFANEPIKHDHERARYKLKLLLGARIIPDILAKYPKTTDINGNGRIIFVDTGESGIGKIQYARYDNIGEFEFTNSQMALPVITDKDIVSFLEFFARRENQMFNAENPLFNGFVDNIRISATHNTISSTGTTFSLRISRPILALNDDNFAPFAPQKVSDLLANIARSRQTLLINGETGTGKTEMLKYYSSFIRPADRIIMVEDVAETQLYNLFPAKDVVAWHTKTYEDYETGATHGISLVNLLKQSLRSYPRFVAVSELRGAETLPAYSSMTAGNPFFGTVHAQSNASVVSRLIDIIRMEFGQANDESMRRQLLINMGFSFHIVRKELSNGRALRYVDEIVYFDETIDDEEHRGMHVLFTQKYLERKDDLYRTYTSYPLPDKLKEDMNGALNYFGDELDKMWGATKITQEVYEKK